jgi:hypothetical protein
MISIADVRREVEDHDPCIVCMTVFRLKKSNWFITINLWKNADAVSVGGSGDMLDAWVLQYDGEGIFKMRETQAWYHPSASDIHQTRRQAVKDLITEFREGYKKRVLERMGVKRG